MTRPRCFVELCAGLASVSLRLQGGRHARPPVSRMGAKTGYADAILHALGLRPGLGADAYLWCEPDPGPRGVLACYPQPDRLREIAAVIRSWSGEEPRALWERLKAEGPVGGAPRWLMLAASNRLINGADGPDGWRNTGVGGTTFGGAEFATPAERVAEAVEAVARWVLTATWAYRKGEPESGFNRGAVVATVWRDRYGCVGTRPPETQPVVATRIDDAGVVWPPVAVADDARAVDPREVARWLAVSYLSYSQDPVRGSRATAGGRWPDDSPDVANLRLPVIEWPPVLVGADARELAPDGGLDGVVAYIDPSYVGTTPYADNLTRAEVVALARRWSEAGAIVCVSEAEPLDLGDGWHHVEITGERRGQRRTFSRQQAEWLTMNREPAVRASVQADLFGGVLAGGAA